MAACPQCRKDLKLNQLSAVFACPHCRAPLRSNYPKVLWWVIPVAVLAEIALYFVIYESTQSGPLTGWVFFSLGGTVAVLVYWALSVLLSQARLDTPSDGQRAI